jgi:hypothetical protein
MESGYIRFRVRKGFPMARSKASVAAVAAGPCHVSCCWQSISSSSGINSSSGHAARATCLLLVFLVLVFFLSLAFIERL